MDETYITVKEKWAYLYPAVDKSGNMIDFYLSPPRNAKAARRFSDKTVSDLKKREKPENRLCDDQRL